MSEAENIDVDLYGSCAEAVQAAIDTAVSGDTIVVCRGEWRTCTAGKQDACEFCARVPYRVGITAEEILSLALAS
jgi:tRNA G26 N,N-dimethylase Trm1